MNYTELFSDKSTKPKEKVEILSRALLENPSSMPDLITFAKSSKDPVKGSCIEALWICYTGSC